MKRTWISALLSVLLTAGCAGAPAQGEPAETEPAETAAETEAPVQTEPLASSAPVFDLETGTVMLNSGYEMPVTGLGTYSLSGETCINAVMTFIRSGGRLIDTAHLYGNEAEIGEAVRRAMEEYGVKREDLFITTKLYMTQYEEPEQAIDEALEKLGLDYIDLMLLHHPGAKDIKAYQAMEAYVDQGKIHSIGLSNWYERELDEFLKETRITPAVVQNEIHPYYQEKQVVSYIQKKGIVTECWYPLGGRGHTSELLNDETIVSIAEAHQVSSAAVILRWDLQRGIVVIPGSSNEDHIRENLNLFDFELSEEEMNAIAGLDRNEKFDWY